MIKWGYGQNVEKTQRWWDRFEWFLFTSHRFYSVVVWLKMIQNKKLLWRIFMRILSKMIIVLKTFFIITNNRKFAILFLQGEVSKRQTYSLLKTDSQIIKFIRVLMLRNRKSLQHRNSYDIFKRVAASIWRSSRIFLRMEKLLR